MTDGTLIDADETLFLTMRDGRLIAVRVDVDRTLYV